MGVGSGRALVGLALVAATLAAPGIGSAAHLERPESVLEHEGAFYASVIGEFTEVDGSLVELDRSGKVVRTVTSSSAGAPLEDPKGLAVIDQTLWVADVRVLRRYDLASGAPASPIEPEKAINLNDLAVDRAGNLWVSDTTGSAFYRLNAGGKLRRFAIPARFGDPNGIAFHPETGDLWFVTSPGEAGQAEIVRRTAGGYRLVATDPRFTELDGIAFVGSTAYVTDVTTGDLWKLPAGGKPQRIGRGLSAPADLAYSATLGRLLIPLLGDGHVARRRV